MKTAPSALSAFLDIRKNRQRKKQKLYKLALGVGFDLTISIYTFFFVIIGFLILYDMLQQYHDWFIEIENMAPDFYVDIFVLLIIRSLIMSYRQPGVLFTSAELQLSLLPYSIQRLWVYCVLNKWVKLIVLTLLGVVFTGLVTSFTFRFLFTVAGLFIVVQILTTIPQWRLFQVGVWYKLLIVFLVTITGAFIRLVLGFLVPESILLGVLFMLLVVANIVLAKRALRQVNWMKIIQTNDLIVWNMFFISKMSNIPIKPTAKQGLVQNLLRSKRSRKPFFYQQNAIYRRIWRLQLFEQKEKIIQVISSIFLILILLSLFEDWILGLAIVVSIFLFGQMSSSFFMAGFDDRLIYSIPWDLNDWKRSYLKWVYAVGSIFSTVILILLLIHVEMIWWIPVQLAFYMYLGSYFSSLLINERIYLLSKSKYKTPLLTNIITAITFVFALFSISYPVASLGVLLLLFWDWSEDKWQNT